MAVAGTELLPELLNEDKSLLAGVIGFLIGLALCLCIAKLFPE